MVDFADLHKIPAVFKIFELENNMVYPFSNLQKIALPSFTNPCEKKIFLI